MLSRRLILMIALMILHSEIHAVLASVPPSRPDRQASAVDNGPTIPASRTQP